MDDLEARVDQYLCGIPPDDRPDVKRMLIDQELIADHPSVEEEVERARALLLARFLSIASRCWLAVWKFDIEFDLWEMVLAGEPAEYGLSKVTEGELAEIIELAEAGDAWIRDIYKEGDEGTVLEIVPLAEWRARWRDIASEARARR